MKQSEDSFFNSTINKIMTLIQIHLDKKYASKQKDEVIETQDLNDIL